MHRFLATDGVLAQDVPVLPVDAARHLKVVRPKPGEEVELFDGRGRLRTFRWDGARLVAAGALREVPRPAIGLTLLACVTKGSRWDWTIEKATELGVTRIVPVLSERTIVRIPAAERAAKRERWMRIAEDAARQSDAAWLPALDAPADFAAVCKSVGEGTFGRVYVGALLAPPPKPLLAALEADGDMRRSGETPLPQARTTNHEPRTTSLGLFVGPEGDFTPEELSALLAAGGVATSFGPTVLRAETAALFGLSALAAWISKENGK